MSTDTERRDAPASDDPAPPDAGPAPRANTPAFLAPDAPGDARVEVAWALGTGVVVAALAATRVPQMFDTLWAEDGSLFLQQALTQPLTETLPQPYAGYWHLIPRTVATAATWAPLSLAAVVFAAGYLLVTAAGAALVEAAAGSVIGRRWLRIGVALPIAVLPVLPAEVLGAVANTQWITAYFCFWALVWVPNGRWGQAAAATVLLATALSTPLTVALVPLALVRLAVRRPGRWIPAAFVVVTVTYALAVHHLAARSAAAGALADRVTEGWLWFTEGVLGNLRPGAPFGGQVDQQRPATFLPDQGWLLMLAVVVAAGALVYAIVRPPTDTRRAFVVGAALLTAAGTWALELSMRSASPRYCAVPALLLVAALGVLVDGGLDRLPTVAGRAAATVVVGPIVLAALLAWSGPTVRDVRPDMPWWRTGVADAWARCHPSADVAVDGAVRIPALPPGWMVTVPCARM